MAYIFFLTIAASVLLVSAQGQGQGRGREPSVREGIDGLEDAGILTCPQRGESGSGSNSGDVVNELGERFRRDLDDFLRFGSGSGSGSGGNGSVEDICGSAVFNGFCYSLVNTTDEILANPPIAGLVSEENAEDAREAACIYAFSEDSCSCCMEFFELCGDPQPATSSEVCADASFERDCSRRGPTDCISNPKEPFICDACTFYTDTCVTSEEDQLARCNAFGFRVLLGCAEVTSQTDYDCECFTPGLVCSFCEDVVTDCTGAEPSLPPGIARQLASLTAEEEENAVTMEFQGVTRFEFLLNDLAFRMSIADEVNGRLSGNPNAKRQAETVTEDDVHYVEPCPCERGDDLDVVFYVSGSTEGTAIDGEVVMQAADAAGDSIANEIGAAAYGGTEQGIPEDDDDDDDDGLSGGEIAGIVVVVTVVSIVAVVAVVVVMVLVFKNHGSHSRREKIPLEASGK